MKSLAEFRAVLKSIHGANIGMPSGPLANGPPKGYFADDRRATPIHQQRKMAPLAGSHRRPSREAKPARSASAAHASSLIGRVGGCITGANLGYAAFLAIGHGSPTTAVAGGLLGAVAGAAAGSLFAVTRMTKEKSRRT